jgi:brefeldin A-inhibited guanine nucleotide-exchange protein
MRSKILCLNIINSILRDFMSVFTSPNVMVRFSRESVSFMQASKNSICLALAMNAPKPWVQVFDISCEIFSLMVNHMRNALKAEIEVFFREIYLPILEMKVSSVDRKSRVVTTLLGPVSRDARTLVEMYLNYDCNGSLMSNIYERSELVFGLTDVCGRVLNVLSKITLTPVHLTVAQAAEHQAAIQAAQAASSAHPPTSAQSLSPTPSHTTFHQPASPVSASPPPSQSGDSTSTHGAVHAFSTSSEYNLKVQALQTLVMALRSLVAWSQQGIAATIESSTTQEEVVASTPVEESPRALTPNPPAGSRSTSQSETTNRAHLIDDPEQFEALKYRKTALQDAIQKFNFKPKRVRANADSVDLRESTPLFVEVSSREKTLSRSPSFFSQWKD